MTRPAFNPVKPRPPGTVKAAIVDLYAQAGGPKHVMVRLGIGESQVYAYSDPQSPEEISFARVAALTDGGATAAAEYLALLAGGIFQAVPGPDSCDALALTAEEARENGEAIACIVLALADGKISGAAARKALPDIDRAIGALAKLRGLLVAAMRE